MKHSSIVGGSTASRVINCPASVNLVAKMPPQPSSKYADEGTLLHNAMAEILDHGLAAEEVLGMTYKEHVLTQDLLDDKILPALSKLSELDPKGEMEFTPEVKVDFGDFMPGVFGSSDLIGRLDNRALILDWKFGSGVLVEAEENMQGLFYAAAAMRTPALSWVFDDVTEVDIAIIQPPAMKVWRTTVKRIKQFEKQLIAAVRESKHKDAPMSAGSHCRWCAAKPLCPLMTGAVDRMITTQLANINPEQIGAFLTQAEIVEEWIADVRKLAHQLLETDIKVPGYKLVAKRASRQWASPDKAIIKLTALGLELNELIMEQLISPPQAEKVLKKHGLQLPDELVISVSSGSTLAEDSDPRPAVLQIGRQISDALSKLN